MRDGLTKEKLESWINESNKKFCCDFELIGSWKEKGYSNHDIDVFTRNMKHVDEAGLWLAVKTGMIVDVFYPGCGGNHNYVIFPDGRADLMENILMETFGNITEKEFKVIK